MSLGDIRNLDHTILLCSKMQETKDFYRDVMGFPLAHDTERWVSFQVGSSLLTLRPRGPGLAEKVPRRYNLDSDLTCDVPPGGTNAANFPLTTP